MTESTTEETVVPSNASITLDDEQQSLPLSNEEPQSEAVEQSADPDDAVDLEHEPVAVEGHEPVADHEDPAFYYGPVGRRRPIALVLALCVITFGLSGLLWHHRNNREMADFDPQMRVHAGRSAWAVAIPWILGLLTTLAGAAQLVVIEAHLSLPFATHISEAMAAVMLAGILAVPYLTLVLPFSAVAVVMTAERIRIIEESSGVTSDKQIRPVAALPLLLIPLAGPVILLAREQSRINATWERISPTPGRRRR